MARARPPSGGRRAENDFAALRESARGKKTWLEQVSAMQQAAQVLRESAQLENRVARGVAQYEAQKQAHKTDDSDPETSGDEDDGADDHYYGLLQAPGQRGGSKVLIRLSENVR